MAYAEKGYAMNVNILGITLDQQIACVRREIGMRERVYPKWVGAGRMKKETASHEISAMTAVLRTLEAFKEARNQALEEAARIAANACLVPPDGGEPTEGEAAVANAAAAAIRAAKSTSL